MFLARTKKKVVKTAAKHEHFSKKFEICFFRNNFKLWYINGPMMMYWIFIRSLETVLPPFCNLILHFFVFYDFSHKKVKKITETAVTLLIRKILKKGCQQSYIINVQRIQKVYWICFLTLFCNLKLHFAVFYGLA